MTEETTTNDDAQVVQLHKKRTIYVACWEPGGDGNLMVSIPNWEGAPIVRHVFAASRMLHEIGDMMGLGGAASDPLAPEPIHKMQSIVEKDCMDQITAKDRIVVIVFQDGKPTPLFFGRAVTSLLLWEAGLFCEAFARFEMQKTFIQREAAAMQAQAQAQATQQLVMAKNAEEINSALFRR